MTGASSHHSSGHRQHSCPPSDSRPSSFRATCRRWTGPPPSRRSSAGASALRCPGAVPAASPAGSPPWRSHSTWTALSCTVSRTISSWRRPRTRGSPRRCSCPGTAAGPPCASPLCTSRRRSGWTTARPARSMCPGSWRWPPSWWWSSGTWAVARWRSIYSGRSKCERARERKRESGRNQ